MAGGVVPNDGLKQQAGLCWATPGTYTEDFKVDLYQNNHTPVQASVTADFTVATFTGYATVTVARSTFGSPSISGIAAVITSSVNPAFSCTGGANQTVYGFIITGATTGLLYFAQLFGASVTMAPGATLTLTPFTLSQESIN